MGKAGVASVKKNAKTSQFETRTSKKGDPYFVLHAKGGTGSGDIIGMSETYQGGMAACKNGIASVIKNKGSPVVSEAKEKAMKAKKGMKGMKAMKAMKAMKTMKKAMKAMKTMKAMKAMKA